MRHPADTAPLFLSGCQARKLCKMGLDTPRVHKLLGKWGVSKQWLCSPKNAEAMCKKSLDISSFVQNRCKMLLWVSGETFH